MKQKPLERKSYFRANVNIKLIRILPGIKFRQKMLPGFQISCEKPAWFMAIFSYI